MKVLLLMFSGCLMLSAMLSMKAGVVDAAAAPPRSQDGAPPDHRQTECGGEPCDAVARGFRAFFDRHPDDLNGNGRSCADCHMASDHFQLSPASVESRFQRLQRRREVNPQADDPLFRPVDADDFRTNGDTASDFSNLRQNGLIRITFPLPPNMKLVDPATGLISAETFVDVWRSVPSVNDVALTGPDDGVAWLRGPNQQGGYQMDARITTLQEQALGAFVNHAQVQGVPMPHVLDDLASFQRVLFSSHRVRVLADAVRDGTLPLPDPDPPLTVLEQQGKAVFQRACGQCHGGPGQSTPQATPHVPPGPVIRFHRIMSQCPRPIDTATPQRFVFTVCRPSLARNARTYEIAVSVPTPSPTGILPPGSKIRRTSSDPGRALITGFVGGPAPLDDWEKFDIPGLRGIARTAPYFHNNSATTLDEVFDHYVEFFKLVQANAAPGAPVPPLATTDGINFDRRPTEDERAALLAYLRKL
jgi:cytochrome c peroxidase